MEEFKKLIRDVPDFPKPGILFRDITPLLNDAAAFKKITHILAERLSAMNIQKIAAIESRGFIFGAPLAQMMNIGFVPVRKHGKLPWTKISQEYVLEYGTDKLEIHADAINPGEKVAIVDDLLATGGTVGAVCHLVEKLGGQAAALAFIVELEFLQGRKKLENRNVFSLVKY